MAVELISEHFEEEVVSLFTHLKKVNDYVEQDLDAGDIVWVNFNKANNVDENNTDSDMNKIRPAIIFQNKQTSELTNHIMVVPIQSNRKVSKITPAIHIEDDVHGVIQVAAMQPINKKYIVNKVVGHEEYNYSAVYSTILQSLHEIVKP